MALNVFGGLRAPVGSLRGSVVVPLLASVAHMPCPTMPCPTKPSEDMQDLHRLARHGNVREIMSRAKRIETLDERYSAFATDLCKRAKNYQTKAIVQFVERHLEGEHAS